MPNSHTRKRKTSDGGYDKDVLRGEFVATGVVKPVCSACGETMMVAVANPYGPGKIHVYCRDKARRDAEIQKLKETNNANL